jgi:hypothetical protein
MSKGIMAEKISHGKNAQLGIEGLRFGGTNTFEKLNFGIERGGHDAKIGETAVRVSTKPYVCILCKTKIFP